MYKRQQGYDARFQVAQAIPVFINELLVRVIYSVRRLVKYFTSTKSEDRSFSSLWKSCEPFSNATVKRMLTVAHGTFCLIDTGDAVARGFVSGGGSFNVAEFAMRLNIVGIGRFTISLYGEDHTGLKRHALKEDIVVIHLQKIMLMCHKVTHKNLIDSSPLFRYYLTHTPCNFFVKPIDSDTSEEI